MNAPKVSFRKRILYLLFKWCGLTTVDIEQALRHRLWDGLQIGTARYLGHCPYHPEELLQELGRGDFSCILCKPDRHIFAPVPPFPDMERSTDKVERPLQMYIQERHAGSGVHTACTKAIPRQATQPSE